MFKISCDEATTICDKSQYGEASFFEKIKLNLHLLMCKICSLYVKQNKTMTQIFKMKSVAHQEDAKTCLSKLDKEALRKEFEKMKA